MHAKYVLDDILGLKGISCISLEHSVYCKHLSAREKDDLRLHDQIETIKTHSTFELFLTCYHRNLGNYTWRHAQSYDVSGHFLTKAMHKSFELQLRKQEA